jgi:hypothetical protein
LERAEKTVDEENEIARAERKSKLRDQARLFREVFGNPPGKAVLEALTVKFQTASGFPPNQLDDQGRTDALQTWRKLGHFDVMAYIKVQIEFKETEHVNSGSSGA